MVKIAIIGFGVVGSGVYEVLRKNSSDITSNANTEIDIKYILDIRDFSSHSESHLFVNDINTILADEEVEIVVETMGGLEPANTFTRKCLERGKSVVTSNKELVATFGDELFELACKNNCKYLYEASVGGGIPIIRPLSRCLAANRIDKIAGILNGTTNYILTRMFTDNASFEDALKEAQEKGYAEKDPTADVEGLDTGKKICILSSMLNGEKINHEDVHTEGITKITLEDTEYAAKFNSAIKLIGMCERVGDKFAVIVAPMLVNREMPLFGVDDVFNGIMVSGNMLGDAMFYGRGAGKLPTASAVVADVIDIAANKDVKFIAPWTKSSKNVLISTDDIKTSMYVRVKSDDVSASVAHIKNAFDGDLHFETTDGEFAFITPKDTIANIKNITKNIPGTVLSEIMVLA